MLAEGEFALAKNYLKDGVDKVTNPVKWGTPVTDLELYVVFVEVATSARDEAGLREYTPPFEELAERDQHKLYRGVAHRAWGVLHTQTGEYAKASERLNKALALFDSLGTRWQVGRTLAELGELAAVQGDAESARDYFTRAIAAYEELRAATEIARVREKLERL